MEVAPCCLADRGVRPALAQGPAGGWSLGTDPEAPGAGGTADSGKPDCAAAAATAAAASETAPAQRKADLLDPSGHPV